MYTDRESDIVYCIIYRYIGYIKLCIIEEGVVVLEGVVVCWFSYRLMKESFSLNLVGLTFSYFFKLFFLFFCGFFFNLS